MRTIATDSSGDIARPTRWVTGAEAVRVRLDYALRLALGEWMLDRSAGLDRERVLGDDLSPLPGELEVTRVASKVTGVARVESCQIRRPTSEAEAEELGVGDAYREQAGRIIVVLLAARTTSGDLVQVSATTSPG